MPVASVLGVHGQDAVRVDVERHLDLGHAARRGHDALEVEAAERAVVARLGALALQHVHLDRRLAVGRRREDLLLLRRDGRVARDHHRHHAAQRLDAERERRHVEQHHVLHVAGEHAGLHGRADGHDLVRVHALVRLLAEELLDRLLHERDARRAADEHDLVDLARLLLRVGERLASPAPSCARRAGGSSARAWRA